MNDNVCNMSATKYDCRLKEIKRNIMTSGRDEGNKMKHEHCVLKHGLKEMK